MKLLSFALLLLLPVLTKAQTRPFKISTTHLTGNVYVYVSYGLPDDKTPFPANGLYVITKAGIVLIDTPWDEDQTQQLIDTLQHKYHQKIRLCISTHFHSDRTAGLDVLKKNGIKTYTSVLTKKLAKQNGNKQPEFTFSKDTVFNVGGVSVQTYYPGEGHTRDNIVIWLPQSKVLFGGCLIKSTETNSIGYVADANVAEWPRSVARVKARFKNIRYVIPGHQGWQGDTLLFGHTLKVIKGK
ncbi:subclass B1 metallo-beta-lactamase [Mucilaginibacter sp. SP1R1]|uniref:subclass B1 metallo-beta-lactamase n=1 Tax=Mucilaginibacter sp. SP1R1 TaxID=2723091 RepID=UPI0016120149|nr:subclass B1 metallo-beta-lactamase [Mucilaginibacter sp. SP1R1]MBB6150978.1 metallo-beta-lactamase class B [Mucilaginibacter sp. SP1R1]